jgi:hypothetical protein
MRVINFKAKKFIVGKKVIIIKTFVNGNFTFVVGEIGKILSEETINLPYMNLFDVRILEIEFSKSIISIGERIAEEYMEMI